MPDKARNTADLHVYSAISGDLLWISTGKPGYGDLAGDVERIYYLTGLELRAYTLRDGQQLWKKQMVGHTGHNLIPNGDELHIRHVGSQWWVDVLDANTGEMLSSDSLVTDNGYALYARFPEFDLYYTRATTSTLWAVDGVTQQILWVAPTGLGPTVLGPLAKLPILVNNVLLVGGDVDVVALNAQTGQVIWRNEEPVLFASDFVVVGDSLYALDYDARLVRLDVKTGQETGHIQFMPARPHVYVSDDFYHVAADGQMLFISFDDSQELIALGP